MSTISSSSRYADLSRILDRVSQSRWTPHVATLVALILLSHSLAKWTWRLMTPESAVAVNETRTVPVVDSGAALRDLLSANLFGIAAPSSLSADQMPVTSLNLTLTGVMVRGKNSIALVRVESGDETPFAIGEEVQAGAMLYAVYPDHAVLARGGLFEKMILKDDTPALPEGSIITGSPTPASTRSTKNSGAPLGVRVRGNRFTVSRQSMSEQLQKPEFLSQALMVPNAGGGFLVREVQPDSVYEKLGVQVGDVIRSVNGQPVNTMDDVMKVYQQIGGINQAGEITVDVARAGQTQTLHYNFE